MSEDTPEKPCPGCGYEYCMQWGDECWTNNGCPATPPVARAAQAEPVLGPVTATLLHVSPDYHVQVRDRLTARVAELEAENEEISTSYSGYSSKAETRISELEATLSRVRALRDSHAHQARGSVFSTGLVEYLDAALGPAPARAEPGTVQKMYDAIVACFDDCQGMGRCSTQESDRYWDLAEDLINMLSKSTGQRILRTTEEGYQDEPAQAEPDGPRGPIGAVGAKGWSSDPQTAIKELAERALSAEATLERVRRWIFLRDEGEPMFEELRAALDPAAARVEPEGPGGSPADLSTEERAFYATLPGHLGKVRMASLVSLVDDHRGRILQQELDLEHQAEQIKRALSVVSGSLPMNSPESRLAGDVRRALGG